MRLFVATRAFSIKVDVSLVAKLRKKTQCTIAKAKEALIAVQQSTTPSDSYQAALDWINKDAVASGAQKAAKVSDRVTAEGLVAAFTVGDGQKALLLELNAETDFAAKSKLFEQLVLQSATSASHLTSQESLFNRVEPQSVLQYPTETGNVLNDVFVETIGRLGENIRLRRVSATQSATPTMIFGSYAHSASHRTALDFPLSGGMGQFASIVALGVNNAPSTDVRKSLCGFASRLAQHVTGFAPKTVEHNEDGEALLDQQFLFGGGTVQDVLRTVSSELNLTVTILGFERLECGEGIEKSAVSFADEVQKQASA